MLWIKCWKFSSLVPIINDQISIKKKKEVLRASSPYCLHTGTIQSLSPILNIMNIYQFFSLFYPFDCFIHDSFSVQYMHTYMATHTDMTLVDIILFWFDMKDIHIDNYSISYENTREKKKHNLIIVILFRNNAIVRL